MSVTKPLGVKAYGSIGHLPNSRLGPSDSCVNEGQAIIATEKTRDAKDCVIVQEKLDGSNTAVCKLNNRIIPLTRSGYDANSSSWAQHRYFVKWVAKREKMFNKLLKEGERISGEWLLQAHGTRYNIKHVEFLFAPFDMFTPDNKRFLYNDFLKRVLFKSTLVPTPAISWGPPIRVVDIMEELMEWDELGDGGIREHLDEREGAVWRVEREGKVDFLCKYVQPSKIDGQYLESQTFKEPIWNFDPKLI